MSGYDKFKFSEIKQSIVESPVVNESPAPVEALKIFKSEEAEATLKSNLASLKNRLAQAVLFVNESEVSVMESTEQPVTELEVTELETSELETTESEMAVLVEPELEVYSSNNSNLTEHVKIKYVWALNLPSVSNERDESYAELERIQKAGIPAEIYEIEINQVLWFRIRIKGFDTEQNAIKYMEKVKRQTGISRYWTNLIQTKAP